MRLPRGAGDDGRMHGRDLPPPAACVGTVCVVLLEPMLGTQGGREGRVNCCPLAMEGSPE